MATIIANTNTDRNRMRIFWLKIAAVFLLLIIRDVGEINVPNFLIIGLCCILSLTFNIKESYAYTVILQVLAVGLQMYYVLAFVILNLLIRKYRYMKMNASFFVVVALLVWETLHAVFPGYALTEWIRYASVILILGLTIFDARKYNDLDGRFILICFIVSVMFVTTDILLQYLQAYGSFAELLHKGIRFGDTTQIPQKNSIYISLNPNQYGGTAALALASCLVLFFNSKWSNLKKCVLIITMILFLLFGIMTQSRTFLVLALCLVFLTIICNVKLNLNRLLLALLMTLLLVGIVVLVLYLCFRDLYDSLIGRFLVEDISNGRFKLYSMYLDIMINEPIVLFFGVGTQNIEATLRGRIDFLKYFPETFQLPHNAVLESVLCWGIMGVVLITLMFVQTVINAKIQTSEHKPKMINYLPMIILAIFIQTGQFVASYDRFLLLLLVYCAIITKNQKKVVVNELF